MTDASQAGPGSRRIALGVGGGIACYKAAEILRRLQDRGFDVVVIMTAGARQFVTPLTFGALSGHKVHTDIFEGEREGASFDGAFDHIFLARSVGLFLVAPATADCIARMAAGIANDFLTTFHLATRAPIVIAPAMNTLMWEHESVRENVRTLQARGVRVIAPETGEMACKTHGPGRLADVEHIVDFVVSILDRPRDLTGRKILVTAGPTVEDIDPVRYLTNRSSGKMGYAVAQGVVDRGGEVVLISGPTALEFPGVVRVRTTGEMRDAVMARLEGVDAVVKAAAPLDFRPRRPSSRKIKKDAGVDIEFEPAPDILRELGARKNGIVLVGFAAETERLKEFALEKLHSKNLDLVVVNSVAGPDSAFQSDNNRVSIIDATGEAEDLPTMSKQDLAHRILDRVVGLL